MSTNYIITLCCLFAGLLFDPAGMLRMVLLASCVHELGHILVFVICTHRMPPISAAVGGLTLGSTAGLSLRQELAVAVAGPLANMLAALCFYFLANIKAAYGLYFFMGANICICLYNLLPFGVLDGARILLCLTPPCKVYKLYKVQSCLLWGFAIACLAVLVCAHPAPTACFALILAPAYLLLAQR